MSGGGSVDDVKRGEEQEAEEPPAALPGTQRAVPSPEMYVSPVRISEMDITPER